MTPLVRLVVPLFALSSAAVLVSGDSQIPSQIPLESNINLDELCSQQAQKAGYDSPDSWSWSPEKQACTWTIPPHSSASHLCAPLLKELDEWLVEKPAALIVTTLSMKPNPSNSLLVEKCEPLIQERVDTMQRIASEAQEAGFQTTSGNSCLSNCRAGCDMGHMGSYFGCLTGCSMNCPADRGGCSGGWCWAGCMSGVPLPGLSTVEWCWTTKTWSQSYNYVRCSRDSDCDLSWKCGGPCAAF